jgi:hypothetical protein
MSMTHKSGSAGKSCAASLSISALTRSALALTTLRKLQWKTEADAKKHIVDVALATFLQALATKAAEVANNSPEENA